MTLRCEQLWLTALTLGVWALVPFGDFHYDDFPNLVLEPSTADLSRATGLRLLSRLSYFLDHSVWGMDPRGFLLTNLLLHLGSVLCVHALAAAPRSAIGSGFPLGRGGACLAAAVFALQPAHAEVVAYASGRATGLMTLLLLAGLVLRARGRRHSGLALCCLAVLAKEVAVIFPLLVWLRERDARELVKSGVAASAVLAVLAFIPRYRELAAWSFASRDAFEALARNASALPLQLSLWLRPWALSVEHTLDLAPSPAAVLGGVALVCALVVAGLAARRREPLTCFAIAWLLATLLPTSSLIARDDPISERALYLAWVGPAIAIGSALARLRVHAPLRGAVTAVLALTVAGAFAWQRVEVWSDARLLWRDAVTKAPASSRAWNNLGMAFLSHDDPSRADAAFRRALALDPANAHALANLHPRWAGRAKTLRR